MLEEQDKGQWLSLGGYSAKVEERLQKWEKEQVGRRIWEKDYTVWSPTQLPEITDRLGWLNLPDTMQDEIDAFRAFADEIKDEGMKHVVLLAMGGSSLAAEIFQATFGNAAGYPQLIVLDSTHPAQVMSLESEVDLKQTLFLVASKSGTTLEPLSFFRYFFRRVKEVISAAGHHFIAITDPATPLEDLATDRGFRRGFTATPDVGGRYSALTAFGLVPAALIGMNIGQLIQQARAMAHSCASTVATERNPGLILGAALGELTLAGRDKVTLVTSPSLAAFPQWLEQLIAESTGKDGKGIIPVVDEPLGPPESYGKDRFFVYTYLNHEREAALEEHLRSLEAAGHPIARIPLRNKAELGAQMFLWEMAIAASASVLGIHPFNQPDVQSAKDLTRKAMDETGPNQGSQDRTAISVEMVHDLTQALKGLFAETRPGDYVGLQAYLPPAPDIRKKLQSIRFRIGATFGLATTLGFGPRFLHSTGQIHKGGPNTGIFLQLIDSPAEDVSIPETNYTFGQLIAAQSLGDCQALIRRGRRVLRIDLGKEAARGLEQLAASMP